MANLTNDWLKINTVLVSVSDKTRLCEFIMPLYKRGVKIISTKSTGELLQEAGIKVTFVEELTGFGEMLGGRVKTLHPVIHAGILADKNNKAHMKQLEDAKIQPIDMVVCNLYPFRETISKNDVEQSDAIEEIDIGGVALLRAAAKNYKSVAVVSSPLQYDSVWKELKTNGLKLSLKTRELLANEAFEYTAAYDSCIAEYFRNNFSTTEFPKKLTLAFEKISDLRYGENPHQTAALYCDYLKKVEGVAKAKQLAGKEMSFNNWLDLNAAVELVQEFDAPAAVIVKHTNPCGCAVADKIEKAFKLAYESDPTSAFGGIIALNRPCNIETAKQISSFFNEVVVAPAYQPDALAKLKEKKNLRIMLLPSLGQIEKGNEFDFKKISGGLLIQKKDTKKLLNADLKLVTKKKPTQKQLKDLLFAMTVAKHVKSNAIVIAKSCVAIGIGAGQMSRIEAAQLAFKRCRLSTKGAVLASDGFFPFPDVVKLAAKHKISAIIQPGGSLNDNDSIVAANKANIAMIFSGMRHFKH